MSYAIYSPQACDPDGGTLIEIQFDWGSAVPLAAFLEGEVFKLPCYGAEAGLGNSLTPYGRMLRCVTPRLADGLLGPADLAVYDSAGGELVRLAVEVAMPWHPTSTYALRKLCPPVWAVGSRGLDEENSFP